MSSSTVLVEGGLSVHVVLQRLPALYEELTLFGDQLVPIFERIRNRTSVQVVNLAYMGRREISFLYGLIGLLPSHVRHVSDQYQDFFVRHIR